MYPFEGRRVLFHPPAGIFLNTVYSLLESCPVGGDDLWTHRRLWENTPLQLLFFLYVIRRSRGDAALINAGTNVFVSLSTQSP